LKKEKSKKSKHKTKVDSSGSELRVSPHQDPIAKDSALLIPQEAAEDFDRPKLKKEKSKDKTKENVAVSKISVETPTKLSHTMTAERMFSGFRGKVVLRGKSWDITHSVF
jgi:hypothetical protein